MNASTTNYRTNFGSPVRTLIGTATSGMLHRVDGTQRAWCGSAYYATLTEVRVWKSGETITGKLCSKCFKFDEVTK